MGRTIPAGSRVLVVPAGRPRLGEVWAFCEADGRLVVHRAMGRRGGRWAFQGDAEGWPDAPVPSEWLIGRVVAVAEPGGAARPLGATDRARGAARVAIRRGRALAGAARRRLWHRRR